MKPAIHLLDPVKGIREGSSFVTARCGMVRRTGDIITTTKTDEVTCIKCKGFINNPWRLLRRYGKVKVLENYYVSLWSDYGFRIDILAYHQLGDTWKILMGNRAGITSETDIEAKTIIEVGFKMVDMIETEILEQIL